MNPRRQAVGSVWPWLLAALLATGCARSRATREMRQFQGTIISQPLTEPVLARARPGVVAVEALDAQGRLVAFGTGFYLGPEQVVTCLHVIEAGTQLQTISSDGIRHDVAGIFGQDLLLDTAVLWVTNPPPTGDGLRLRERPAEIGETAYVLAAPKQLPVTASKGSVTALLDLGSDFLNQALALSVPAVPGFSGGPVLDAAGAVIGVLSQVSRSEAGRSSVAIPVTELRGLTEGMPEAFSIWRQKHPPLDPRAEAAVSAGERAGPGHEAEALAHFNRALTIAPNCTRAWVRKGHLLFRQQRYRESAEAFRQGLALEPGLLTARLFLSMCLGLNNQMPEALAEANLVVEQRPRSALGQMWLGAVRLGTADPLGAVASVRVAIGLDPGQPMARNNLGQIWNSLGCPEAAERRFREVVGQRPNFGPGWSNLGHVLLESGRAAEATEAFNRALAAPPHREQAGAAYGLFNLAVLMGDPKLARTRFEDFIARERAAQAQAGDPHRILPLLSKISSQAWNSPSTPPQLLGLFQRTQRPTLTRLVAEQQVKSQPDDPDRWTLLAELCNRTGRFERAREAAQRVIAMKHDHGPAHLALGVAHCGLGELNEARPALIKASVFLPRQADVQLTLACVEARAGNPAKAAEFVQEAKRLRPGIPARYEAHPESFILDAQAIRAAAAAD